MDQLEMAKNVVFKITVTQEDINRVMAIIDIGCDPTQKDECREHIRAITEKGEAVIELADSLLRSSVLFGYLRQEQKKRKNNDYHEHLLPKD